MVIKCSEKENANETGPRDEGKKWPSAAKVARLDDSESSQWHLITRRRRLLRSFLVIKTPWKKVGARV